MAEIITIARRERSVLLGDALGLASIFAGLVLALHMLPAG